MLNLTRSNSVIKPVQNYAGNSLVQFAEAYVMCRKFHSCKAYCYHFIWYYPKIQVSFIQARVIVLRVYIFRLMNEKNVDSLGKTIRFFVLSTLSNVHSKMSTFFPILKANIFFFRWLIHFSCGENETIGIHRDLKNSQVLKKQEN